jgi:hypothetical protein
MVWCSCRRVARKVNGGPLVAASEIAWAGLLNQGQQGTQRGKGICNTEQVLPIIRASEVASNNEKTSIAVGYAMDELRLVFPLASKGWFTGYFCDDASIGAIGFRGKPCYTRQCQGERHELNSGSSGQLRGFKVIS